MHITIERKDIKSVSTSEDKTVVTFELRYPINVHLGDTMEWRLTLTGLPGKDEIGIQK